MTSTHGSGVAAVVVTFNRVDTLRKCLQALFAQTCPVDEVIVVDNASTDRTTEMLATEFPQVRHLRMPTNRGPAGGFAAGLSAASAGGHRWIWLFNDDDRPEPHALATLLRTASDLAGQRLGMLGSWLRSDEGEVIEHGLMWRGRQLPCPPSRVDDPPHRVDVLIFAGTLVDARVVREVGVTDERYFMMIEELEYCLRAGDAGWRLFVLPQPLTLTEHAGAVTGSTWRSYYQTRNQLLMCRRRRSGRELLWWGVRQAKFVVGILLWGDRKANRLRMRALGAWHGLRGIGGMTIDPASES